MIYLELFITFFKIGLFTIGGGYAMIPLIQQEVIQNGWLNMTQLIDFIGIAEATPGAFAVNIATFVGIETGGFGGGCVATLAVILPSFIIILLIAKIFTNFQYNKWVQGALYGMRPVVVGLISSAVFVLMSIGFINTEVTITGIDVFFQVLNYKEILIFGICSFFYFKFKWHPIKLILTAAGLGIMIFGVIPLWF
jgi:chromate transporter